MQEKHLFEYAVVRVVPRVERGEFLNAGVILYCRDRGFLQMKFTLDEGRVLALDATADIDELRTHLEAFEQISLGSAGAGPIASLDAASRFRWLTAKRSTSVQSSDVHPGLCSDPAQTLDRLHRQLVLS